MKPLIKETQDKRFVEVIGHYDNPILCAKLTAIADLFAVEKKEGYAKFRIEDESKLAVIDDGLKFRGYIFYVMGIEYTCELVGISWTEEITTYSSYFEDFSIDNGYVYYKNHQLLKTDGTAVLSTDYLHDYDEYYINLAGTKWVFNDNITISFVDNTWDLVFASNNTNYSTLRAKDNTVGKSYQIFYGSTAVWTDDEWSNQAYRIISITGGTDTTNATLIEWLLANATQVPVTDLSNTEWLINDVPNTTYGYGEDIACYINFTSNNTNYLLVEVSYEGGYIRYYTQMTPDPESDLVYDESNGGTWYNSAYKTISISNGTDTTNPDLIAWLSQNATYQEEPQPSANKIFFGSLPISKILYGNKEVEEIYWGSTKIYSKNN